MSWAEILDLSHSVLPRSVVAIFASEVVCLESLGRGGINNGKGEKCAWLSSRSVGAMEIGAEKAEDVCPHLHDVSKGRKFWARRSVNEQL